MKMSRRTRGGVASLGLLGMALLIAAFLAPGAQAYSQSYQALAPSPVPLTSVAADPTSGLIYAQENDGEADERGDAPRDWRRYRGGSR